MDQTERPPEDGGTPSERTEPTDERTTGPADQQPAAPERPTPAARPVAPAGERPAPPPRPAAPAGERPVPPRPAQPGAPGAAPRPAAPAAPRPAAAPAPKEPAPDPEEVVALRELAPDLTWERRHGYVEVTLPLERLLAACRLLRDRFGYDYLSSITAVDWRDRFELVYHLFSYNYKQRPGGVVLHVFLPRPALPEYPLAPSLTRLWPGAELQEREIYDLMGIKFTGHPDLRRVLLTEDFPGHPLRKDFVFDYEYVLMRHLRYGVEGDTALPR